MGDEIPNYYWNNLLAITTKAQAEDPTANVTENRATTILDDDSRKWLENVMKDLVKETDPFRQLQSVIDSLHQYASNVNETNEEDAKKILELAERADDLLSIADLSKQFIDNGGLLILETFIIQSTIEEARSKFAQIILTWAENNEIAQNAIVESGLLKKLIVLLSDKTISPILLSSVLSAISGTVRSNLSAFLKFKEINGPEEVLKLVKNASQPHISAKSARILTSISYTMHDYADQAKCLNSAILESYVHLVGLGNNFAELEYIREYLQNDVDCNDFDESQQASLKSAIDIESQRDKFLVG